MNRVALITGVAGGIGRATAELFHAAHWHVIGVDRVAEDKIPGVGRFVEADIADPKTPAKILADVSAQEGRLDALVLNAAVQICGSLLQTSVEVWDRTMTTNVRSPFLFSVAAHPLLKKNDGAIINVSSVHALATSKGIAAYAASKGALAALTRAMALEFAEDNIRVNAILPGAVDTPMLHAGLERGLPAKTPRESMEYLSARHPLGRIGRPEEIARAIFFLADGKSSSFITGHSLVIDGGAVARLSTE
jgi:NAD(P)-dependent dehydrogenase (short-subunit alcohol dehydrogenase family)